LVDKKTTEEILNMVQEDRKILNTIWWSVISINGWVMCYSMMDCCVTDVVVVVMTSLSGTAYMGRGGGGGGKCPEEMKNSTRL